VLAAAEHGSKFTALNLAQLDPIAYVHDDLLDQGRQGSSVCVRQQPSTAPSFTERQGQYLAFIDAYTRVNGRPPAEADLQRHFGVSAPSAHQMVVTLERAGLIRRQSGAARSIEMLVDPRCLPLLQPPQTIKVSVQKD
jgi:SOS-response transcriptional repressor LexA